MLVFMCGFVNVHHVFGQCKALCKFLYSSWRVPYSMEVVPLQRVNILLFKTPAFVFNFISSVIPSGIHQVSREKIKKEKSALCFRLSEAFGCGLYWNWVHSQHVEALILVLWMCTLFLDNEKLRH
jgi:hypothetical protein